MTTVTIPIKEYEKLKKGECVIEINNYAIPVLEKEVMKYRLMIEIMANPKSFKHDKIRVPRVGDFFVTELKKEIEQITGSKYK